MPERLLRQEQVAGRPVDTGAERVAVGVVNTGARPRPPAARWRTSGPRAAGSGRGRSCRGFAGPPSTQVAGQVVADPAAEVDQVRPAAFGVSQHDLAARSTSTFSTRSPARSKSRTPVPVLHLRNLRRLTMSDHSYK